MKVLVFGTFDRLHPGHEYLFHEAKKRGDLYVVVARDSNVERFKGRPPEQNEKERMEAIKNLYPDAHVHLGHESDYLESVRSVHPDLILLGYDQKLPPGVTDADLLYPVERAAAFHPEKFKSSLLRKSE